MKGMLKIIDRRVAVAALLAVGLVALPAPAAHAAEISVLVGAGSPGEAWGTVWGGMLTITLFNIVHGEIEGARQSGAFDGTSIYSAAAKAYIGPTIGGRFVPYGGIGAGVYHESLPAGSDQGTSGLLFVGAKLKFPLGLVLRGEYQWVNLPDAVVVALDNRYFFAVGLSF
jgi:opacity protein-like surface antigen